MYFFNCSCSCFMVTSQNNLFQKSLPLLVRFQKFPSVAHATFYFVRKVVDIGLNQRQKIFASEYLRTGNAYQSATLAGYSEAYARGNVTKLLENESVKSFIQAEMDKMHDKNIMSAREALSILSDIARGKRDEEVLMMNPVTGEVDRLTKKADNATVIKAIQEILKRYPTAKQSEKMELEIEKLKAQLETGNMAETNITIVDRWAEDDD